MLTRSSTYRALSAVFVLLVAAAVEAADFRMSGSITTSTGTSTTRLIPATLVPVSGTAGTLMIPAQAFLSSGFQFRAFSFSASIAQAATSFTSSNAAVTLAPGAGPGSTAATTGMTFSWCPQGNFPCTDPDQFSQATGNTGFHGQLIYSAGGGYGGTFRVLRSLLGSFADRVTEIPPSWRHSNYLQVVNTNPWGGGIPVSEMFVTFTGQVPPSTTPMARVITSFGVNGALGPDGSIQTIGTTLGLPGGGVGNLNIKGFDPPGAPRFVTGFPATTGMIFAFDRTGAGASKHTWTGSDNRDGNGHGNITLVASGYSNNLTGQVFPHRLTVRMSIMPTVPSLGRLGLASLGLLLIVGAGVMLRRRQH